MDLIKVPSTDGVVDFEVDLTRELEQRDGPVLARHKNNQSRKHASGKLLCFGFSVHKGIPRPEDLWMMQIDLGSIEIEYIQTSNTTITIFMIDEIGWKFRNEFRLPGNLWHTNDCH